MARTSLKRLLLGATTLGFSLSASVAAIAADATDQKINDPRDHSPAVNCVQSTHSGQKRYAEELGTLAAFGCATQDNDPDRAEDESTVILSATETDNGGDDGGGDDGGGDDGGGDDGGGDTTTQSSSLVYGGVVNIPTDEEGSPAIDEVDSLASVTIGTTDPDNADRPAVVDLRIADGLVDNGSGEAGALDVTVLDAINGDGTGEGATGTELDGVLKIGAENAPGGATPPENIDGIAEVNLGTDPDPAGFNAVQVDTFNDEIAEIGHVTVGDGLFDENLALQDGDLGTELIGIDLGGDPTFNENDNVAQVTLDNPAFDDLGEALGIDYVDVVNPPIEGEEPGLNTLIDIGGNPDGALAPLVGVFQPDEGGEPGDPPVILSSSLVFAGVADLPTDEEGNPDPMALDSIASVTLGTADPETHPGRPSLVDVRVGDGLIDGGEGQEGYLGLTVLDVVNGDEQGATGTPLDGVLGIAAETPPAGVTPPEHMDGIAEVNLGTDPDMDGFNPVQANVINDETAAIGHVTVGDGVFDENLALQDGDVGSELIGIDLGEDPNFNENDNVAQVTLDNENFATLGDALGIRAIDVVTPPAEGADPGLVNLLEIDGPAEGGLAPLVDLFRPVEVVPDDGEEPTGPSTSLVYVNSNKPTVPKNEEGDKRFGGIVSLTVGTAPTDAETPHPGDKSALDVRVGHGLIGDGAGGRGYGHLIVREVQNDGSPLDGIINFNADTPPSGFLPPEAVGSVVQANLGPARNDHDFDVVDVDLENALYGGPGSQSGLGILHVLNPSEDPGLLSVLAIEGNPGAPLAPIVDVVRPAGTTTGGDDTSSVPELTTMPGIDALPGVDAIVAALPAELQGARAADAGQIMRSVDQVLGGEAAGGAGADPTTILEDTLGGVLGLLR